MPFRVCWVEADQIQTSPLNKSNRKFNKFQQCVRRLRNNEMVSLLHRETLCYLKVQLCSEPRQLRAAEQFRLQKFQETKRNAWMRSRSNSMIVWVTIYLCSVVFGWRELQKKWALSFVLSLSRLDSQRSNSEISLKPVWFFATCRLHSDSQKKTKAETGMRE